MPGPVLQLLAHWSMRHEAQMEDNVPGPNQRYQSSVPNLITGLSFWYSMFPTESKDHQGTLGTKELSVKSHKHRQILVPAEISVFQHIKLKIMEFTSGYGFKMVYEENGRTAEAARTDLFVPVCY